MAEYLDGNMDVINQPAPALSATSDMPVVEPAPKPDPAPELAPEAAPDPAPEPGDDTPPVEVASAKEPRGVGKALKERDDLIAAERKRADDTAELLRQATEALKKATEKPAEPVKAEEVAPRPKREQFNDPDAYEDALIEWSGNRAAAVAQKRLADDQATAEQTRVENERAAATKAAQETADRQWNDIRSKHMDRRTKAIDQWSDYEAVAEADDVQITRDMGYTIMQMENGPAIAYHLGKTPAEAERISKLPPPMQIAEIGRLSALVAGPRAAAPRPPPPAPITPVGGNSRAGAAPSLTDMTTESYVETRLKEMGSAAHTRH